jgi:hypothetical protein
VVDVGEACTRRGRGCRKVIERVAFLLRADIRYCILLLMSSAAITTATKNTSLMGETVTLDGDFYPSAVGLVFEVRDCRLANGEYLYGVVPYGALPGAGCTHRDLPASDLAVFR